VLVTRTVTRAYKTELALTDRHVTACKRHAGAARYAYKWGLARKQNGSKNRKKAARTLGNAYRTVSHQRANTLHQVTTRLANTKAVLVIVIEDLSVAGLLKHQHLAQALADGGLASSAGN
jgi:transposase